MKKEQNFQELQEQALNIPVVSHNCINELLPLIADNYHAQTTVHKGYYINTRWGTINGKIFIRCQLNPIANCG